MDKPTYKLVGAPCGQHGQYTFYKAIRLTGATDRIYAIGDFFFVRIWQDSELVSIGELQLLWTDRVSDQTLVSLRLYFLPENTPDGRGLHGEDEVLAINDKVVLRAEDLLSWVCCGAGWRWGLRAVWRGACAPPADAAPPTQPLHHTRLDFSDIDKEKSAISVDEEAPGVVVFSYPRYCRYRALLARLEGIQADWLRDSLVAALGGYAAPTKNTRILYCKDTFEYPELEGHEFVCNHLAPKLKGRPRGRRRRAPRSLSRSRSPDSRSSDSDRNTPETKVQTPRRLSLRNGPEKQSEEEEEVEKKPEEAAKDEAFLQQLRNFATRKGETLKITHSVKHVSLRSLYVAVVSVGGYEAACRSQFWRRGYNEKASKVRRLYERYLLQFENHERWNGRKFPRLPNGRLMPEPKTIDTIEVTDSPVRDIDNKPHLPEKRLRTPSPKKPEKPETTPEKHEKLVLDNETGELLKEELNITSKPAEELNREFLESLPPKDEEKSDRTEKTEKSEKPVKIFVKPVEKLIEPSLKENLVKIFEENTALAEQKLADSSKSVDDKNDGGRFLNELAQKLHLGNSDTRFLHHLSQSQSASADSLSSLSSLGDKYTNGHANVEQKSRPAPTGRSSLRAVRVKPARGSGARRTPPVPPPLSDSASSSPPLTSVATTPTPTPTPTPAPTPSYTVTNFGIHYPRPTSHSDDEIVEVPYQPKSPEIIDLDEYPESPQGIKKRKLDILKERGLEVTAVPPGPVWPLANPIAPLVSPSPIILNPVQHQILTQAQMFQMYSIIPNYPNGAPAPKVIQASSAFGNAGPEKTVYGNPKDPFMPPPHVIQGTPIKPQRSITTTGNTPTPQDILDLTCKTQKPAVEIVKIPSDSTPSPSKSNPQNLSKNYTILDGKAVVSNLEITLVNPKSQTPPKKQPQKRSSNGKFASAKTPTPPKEYPKTFPTPKKQPITIPNYQINKEESPSSSTQKDNPNSSSSSNLLQNVFKNQNLAQMMEMQKVPITPMMDPLYMQHIYNSLGQMDPRQLALYRDFMTNQFRGYTGLLNMATPTTKN